jgi:hypothetical protein
MTSRWARFIEWWYYWRCRKLTAKYERAGTALVDYREKNWPRVQRAQRREPR